MDFKQVLHVPNVARIQIIIWPRYEKYFEKRKCAFEMKIDSINYYFNLKEKLHIFVFSTRLIASGNNN